MDDNMIPELTLDPAGAAAAAPTPAAPAPELKKPEGKPVELDDSMLSTSPRKSTSWIPT